MADIEFADNSIGGDKATGHHNPDGSENSRQSREVVKGTPVAQPGDELFWFNRPRLILYLIHFVLLQVYRFLYLLINFILFLHFFILLLLLQNTFQLAFFAWTWVNQLSYSLIFRANTLKLTSIISYFCLLV